MAASTRSCDLLRLRPDVLEIDRLALLAGAERLAGQVDLHRAGERIGDDQRRRGEIVGPHVRIDAALEIAVAGEHRGGDQIVLAMRRRDLRRERAGIADAGGAAVADEVEAELVERLLQAGLLRDSRDHLAARRERGLDPGLDLQALGDRLLGEQAGGDHHARVRGVGAGGDRGDHHVAVAEIVIRALDLVALARARRPSRTRSSARRAKPAWRRRGRTRSCGRFGPASDGATSPRSSSSVSVNTGSGVEPRAPEPCALA